MAGKRRRIARTAQCVLALGLCASAALPQDGPDSVTVTGTRLKPEEIRQRATDYVRIAGVAEGDRPVARWIDPICPKIFGLAPEQAARIERAVRDAASEAGAKVAGDRCESNIAISFNRDAAAVVRQIAARAPGRVAQVSPSALERLRTGADPVRWWYAHETRSSSGQRGAREVAAPTMADGVGGGGGGSVLPQSRGGSLTHYGSSMISTREMRALTGATIVVDIDRTRNVPFDAVAAYVALVALAEIRLGDAAPAGSVLTLFDPASPVDALSVNDRAFLRALYSLPMDRTGRLQRGKLIAALIAAQERE